jgi:hypothetical protein
MYVGALIWSQAPDVKSNRFPCRTYAKRPNANVIRPKKEVKTRKGEKGNAS